jgi:hypothetical protein
VETSYLRLTERRARSFLPGTEPFSSCRPGSFRPAPCPIFSPLFGGQSRSGTVAFGARQADRKESPRRCGTGCWKKRTPACNEPDTGQACPARKGAHVQQVLRCEKAGRTTLKREGDRRQEPMRRLLAHPLLRPVSAGQVASCKHRRGRSTYVRVAGSENRPLKCLSPVRGNSHAGFLEGCGGREAPVPTRPATGPPRIYFMTATAAGSGAIHRRFCGLRYSSSTCSTRPGLSGTFGRLPVTASRRYVGIAQASIASESIGSGGLSSVGRLPTRPTFRSSTIENGQER